MRCSYILYRSSTTGNICNPWHFAKMPRYHTVKCGLGRVKPVLVSLSSQQYANPLSLEVRASPHLRVPRVSDQKSLSNEDGLFGRDSKVVFSPGLLFWPQRLFEKSSKTCVHAWILFSSWTNGTVTMTLSNPSQLTVGETLYYDESTSQLIFKGGPYYLIGWTKMK